MKPPLSFPAEKPSGFGQNFRVYPCAPGRRSTPIGFAPEKIARRLMPADDAVIFLPQIVASAARFEPIISAVAIWHGNRRRHIHGEAQRRKSGLVSLAVSSYRRFAGAPTGLPTPRFHHKTASVPFHEKRKPSTRTGLRALAQASLQNPFHILRRQQTRPSGRRHSRGAACGAHRRRKYTKNALHLRATRAGNPDLVDGGERESPQPIALEGRKRSARRALVISPLDRGKKTSPGVLASERPRNTTGPQPSALRQCLRARARGKNARPRRTSAKRPRKAARAPAKSKTLQKKILRHKSYPAYAPFRSPICKIFRGAGAAFAARPRILYPLAPRGPLRLHFVSKKVWRFFMAETISVSKKPAARD